MTCLHSGNDETSDTNCPYWLLLFIQA